MFCRIPFYHSVLQSLQKSEELSSPLPITTFHPFRLLREVAGQRAPSLEFMDAEGEEFAGADDYHEISDFGHLNYLFGLIANPNFINPRIRFRHFGPAVDDGGVMATWFTNNWRYLTKPSLGIFALADYGAGMTKRLTEGGLVLNPLVDPGQARAIARMWGMMEIAEMGRQVGTSGITQSPPFSPDFIDLFISGPINRFDRGHEQKVIRKYVLKHTQDLREHRAWVHINFLEKKLAPINEESYSLNRDFQAATGKKTEDGQPVPIPDDLIKRLEVVQKQINRLKAHINYWRGQIYKTPTGKASERVGGIFGYFAQYVEPDDMNVFFKARRWHPQVSEIIQFLSASDAVFDSTDLAPGQITGLERALPFYYDQVVDALVNRVLEARRAFREALNVFYDVRSSTRGTSFALAYHHRVGSAKKLAMHDIIKSMTFENCGTSVAVFVEDVTESDGKIRRRQLTGEGFIRRVFQRLGELDKLRIKLGKDYKEPTGVDHPMPQNLSYAEALAQFVCADSSKPPEGTDLKFVIACTGSVPGFKDFVTHTCFHKMDVNTVELSEVGKPRLFTVEQGLVSLLNHIGSSLYSLTES